ncbi:MAG TPA: response regulator transcription factor [Candidatus Limnocylindria bacterium]|nr:response regulator transcription factor [Candidatus Limnocylindria bacterium]
MPLTVLVVDDDEDTRWLLAATLRGNPGVTVVGSAGDGEEAVAFVRHERPDLLIPRLDGLEAAQRIKREWPNTKGIVLGVWPKRPTRSRPPSTERTDFSRKRRSPRPCSRRSATSLGEQRDPPRRTDGAHQRGGGSSSYRASGSRAMRSRSARV